MRKIALLLALALSSTMVFVGCGYTNSTETAANVEGNDMVGTTWVLTDFEMGKPPVEPPSEALSENSAEDPSESRPEPPSGEEMAEYLNASLEFGEDGKVTFTSNNGSKEMGYSDNYAQEDGNYRVAITGESENTFTGVVEDGTMTFSNITGGKYIFTKQ